MKYWTFYLAVLVSLGIQSAAQAKSVSDTPIITMDFFGGRLARQTDAPVVSIFADGRVVMPAVYVHSQNIEETVPVSMVDDLVRHLVMDAGFFDLDLGQISKQVSTRNLNETPVHAPLVEITAHVDGNQRTITFRQVTTQSLEFARLVQLRKRIEHVMAYAQVGGQVGVDGLLQDVNQELHRKSAKAPAFYPEHLVAGKRRADGTLYARFARQDSAGEVVASTIRILPTGEKRIGVGEVR